MFKERSFRTAKGWFSYELRNSSSLAKTLRVTYYGRDRNRQFDIYANGGLLATEKMDGNGADAFSDKDYALPAALVDAKPTTITVKFVAKNGSSVANVFEVRLLK